jgi:hypothetical protein
VRSRRASPASRLAPTQRGFEVLEARHALTFAELLPTLADVRQSAYQTEDRSLFFTNQQKAAVTGVNVGGEVTLYSLRPAFAANYAIDVRAARGSGMDPAIALYDEAGDQVAVNDDASLADSSSRLVVPLLAGQHYCLAVTSYDTTVTGGYTVDVAAQIGDDSHENNNTRPRATAIPLAAAVQGVMADNRDLYVVVLKGVGRLGSSVSIDFDNSLGDLDLTLLDRRGREITRSEGTTDREVVSLAGLPPGRYYLDVHGYGAAYNPAYTLTTDIQVGTTRAAAIPADAFESNNTRAAATNLGTVTATSLVNNLTLTRRDVDFFKFTIGQPGTSTSEVLAQFENGLGDIDLQLLDSAGRVLATSNGVTNVERVSLAGRPAGTYYLKVYGYNGAANPSYSLRFNHGIVLAQPVSLPYQGPPIQPPPVTPPVGSTGAWTIAVYMTSTDLASFAFDDINEMEYAASRFAPGAKIVVFWDQWSKGSYATGGGAQAPWGTAGRATIAADTNANQIATSFEIVGERNTGDPAVLRDFLTWTMTVAPATNYGLVMWDHGGGLSGVNFDDESGYDSITVKELQSAVTQSGMSPKVLAYDACLMGNTEQFYELRALAPVQVASEEVINGPGYDYRTCFAPLESQPASVTPQALAQGIVNSFTAQYGSDGSSTIAAISSDRMPAVAAAVKSFVTASAGFSAAQIGRVRTVLGQVTHFEYVQYADLRQLMSRLAAATDLPAAARTAATSVVTAINAAVFAKMSDQRLTGGMSIYLPSKAADEMSDIGLFTDWAAATGWNGLVNRVLGRTAAVRSPGGLGTWIYAPRGSHA